ncbi:MAG TPA: hypothetical protein VJU61_13100 [Polyangiaceae bacterium]|nr:hypothetical protein [Polyangiaceae bacterium]
MKTRQLSAARALACGLALLGSVAFGCDARVDALGTSETELSTIYPNAEVCPEAPTEAMKSVDRFGDLTELGVCNDVPAGTLCGYDVRNADGAYTGWATYVCGCSVEGNWKNVGSANSGYACPDLAPLEGAPCEPLPSNESCPYFPDQQAFCVGGLWHYYEPTPRYPCDLLGVIVP